MKRINTRYLVGMMIGLSLILGSRISIANEDMVTRVELKSTVRVVDEVLDLRVGDVVEVVGPQSEKIEGLVFELKKKIVPGKWVEFDRDDLKAILDDASGVHMGSIIIEGDRCSLMHRPGVVIERERAKVQEKEPMVRDPKVDPVLKDQIERWVYSRLGSGVDTTRIRFESRDDAFLNTSTLGRIVQIGEFGRSTKMSLHIVIYEGEQIVLDRTVRFAVEVERAVRVSGELIRRGSKVSAESSVVEMRWLSPMVPIVDPEQAIGLVCRSSVDPGTVLLSSMLEEPILIERGEIVSATSLSGSVSVAMSVRAREAGRLGELIEFESRDRSKRMMGRVAGSGRVVIVNPKDQGQKKVGS